MEQPWTRELLSYDPSSLNYSVVQAVQQEWTMHRTPEIFFYAYEVVAIILASCLPLIWSGANWRNANAMACPVSPHTFVCISFPLLGVNCVGSPGSWNCNRDRRLCYTAEWTFRLPRPVKRNRDEEKLWGRISQIDGECGSDPRYKRTEADRIAGWTCELDNYGS